MCVIKMKRKNRILDKNLLLYKKEKAFELLDLNQYVDLGLLSILMFKHPYRMHKFHLQENSEQEGFWVKSNNKNKARIILGEEFNPCVYRGQNCDFGKLTPSFQRKDMDNELNRCIAYIQREEFKRLFKTTPYYQILTQLQVRECHFEFDLEALAQHYDFKSNYIDISKDIKVALFFAYTEYKNGKYYPIENFSKYETPPVLYTANYYELLFFEDKMLQPVGFQAALRPQMQKAMALNIGLNSDAYKHFIKTQLKPNKKFAEWIYNYFDGGKALFPDEPVQVLRNMVVNKVELTKSLFYKYCQIYKVDSKVLSEELINAGYIITDFKIEINADLKKSIEEDIYQRILPWLKTHIFCRKVKLPKENEEHMYIQMFPELPKI